MNEKYLESAMLFARLYGIAETLNPWSYIDNEKFTCIIKEWTDEFINVENGDVLKFFEWKISQVTRNISRINRPALNHLLSCILICPIHDTPKSRKVYLTSLS